MCNARLTSHRDIGRLVGHCKAKSSGVGRETSQGALQGRREERVEENGGVEVPCVRTIHQLWGGT